MRSPVSKPVDKSTGTSGPRTRSLEIYEQLRRDIVHGRLQPGAKLRLDELRTTYEIGMSPLREALMKLAAERLVILEEHKGFCVTPVSRTDLQDIVFMRAEVEVLAIRLSIQNGDDRWEANIFASLYELNKRPRLTRDGLLDPEWEKRHMAFHLSLGIASQSARLQHLRLELFQQSDRYRRLSAQAATGARDVAAEHKELASTVASRDIDRATNLIRQHFQRTADILLASVGQEVL